MPVVRALIFVAIASGCGARISEQPHESAPRPLPHATESRGKAPAPPSASAASAGSIELEPLEPTPLPEPVPRIEFLEPAFGDVLDPELARRAEVRVRVDNVLLTPDAAGVVVSLDGRRPRRVLEDRVLSLADWIPEDEALALGQHVLFAVALDADGRALRGASARGARPLSELPFFVGAPQSKLAGVRYPELFCLSPTGTYYVKPEQPLVLDVLALSSSEAEVSLRVEGRGVRSELTFDPRHPQLLSGLPLGDVRLIVGMPPGPRAECVVTLNPERGE
jgi:hypothetical protein